MIRFLVLLAVVFAAALGFTWLKGVPGEVTLTLGDTAYAVDLTTAVITLFIAIVVGMTLIWLVREILRAPWRLAGGWRHRSMERGRTAQSQGLMAIAAGDLRTAERAMQDAAKRLPDQPLTKLLRAQTAQLKGNRARAREIFQEMTEDSATRIAGLRGLYIEAEREGEHLAAHQIAERARSEAPSAPWAARALLRHQTAGADWDAALATLTGAVDGRIVDKRTARRQRAVILTAKALAQEDGEPDAARAAALEAHDLAHDLVPAAVVAGRLLARQGDIRRATRVLEAAWKTGPHPEIADAYLHVRSGDAASDRLKRAETLFRIRPHADEGRHAVARAAIDARDFARAREVLTPLVTERPTQKALILMGELEEAESGDRGRARGWLARAVYAPRDPAWTADGVVLEEWVPLSPVTGNLDAVEWKVPLAELEGPKMEIDVAELKPLPPAPSEKESKPAEESQEAARATKPVEYPEREGEQAASSDEEAQAPAAPAAKTVTAEQPAPSAPDPQAQAGVAASREHAASGGSPGGERDATAATPDANEDAASDADETPRDAPPAEPPRPDDPGVGGEEEEEGAPTLPSFLSRDRSSDRRHA